MFYLTEIQAHVIIALLSFLISVVLMFVTGYVAYILGRNRGFTRTQFWWGFFLGIIGIMWVAIMPTYRVYDDEKDNIKDARRRELEHYVPALKPKYPMNEGKPKATKKPEYWDNRISSISEEKEESKE